MEQSSTVSLNLEGKVEIVEWVKSSARVHVTVSLEGGRSEVLKSLISLDRHRVDVTEREGILLISSASMEEKVEYTVFLPVYGSAGFEWS